MDLLPDYARVTAADVESACSAALEGCEELLARALAVPDAARTFGDTVLPLEEARLTLLEAWQAWGVLAQVSPDGAVRTAARDGSTRLISRHEALCADDRVLAALTAFAETGRAGELAGADALLLRQMLAEQERGGAGLPPAGRAVLRDLTGRITTERTAYRAQVQAWSDGIVVDGDDLAGLPEQYVGSLEEVEGGRLVSLAYPQLRPFLAHAVSRERRRELLVKDRCKGGAENLARLERIVALRARVAALLGHTSWTDHRMHDRMVPSRPAALAFLAGLRERLAPKVAADVAEMAAASAAAGGPAALRAWDEDFAMARLTEQRYAVDDLAIAEYFPLPAVLEGMFEVTGTLFGLRFAPAVGRPVWHPDVTVVDVLDTSDGERVLGQVYFDLFPRTDKYGHAMTAGLRTGRRLPDGTWRTPAAALVTNLTPPSGERPSLLRHRELVTLFHEFGHALHWVLSRAEHGRHAGEAEMDFMEVPSQLLEQWVWEPSVLRRFARHHATGEPLPQEMVSALLAARTAGSGVLAMRTVLRAEFDMELHGPDTGRDSVALLREVSGRCGTEHVEGTHFHSGWTHMVGYYDASYYSYLWSRMIAVDLYTRFERSGPLDPATGAALRREVMEPGGTVPAEQMVRAFLGRGHDPAAYLRHLGLTGAGTPAA